jgi:hypothetical protein
LRRIVISYVLGIVKTGEGVMPEYDGIDGISGPGLAGGRDGNLCLCNRCTAEHKQKRGKKFVHATKITKKLQAASYTLNAKPKAESKAR